MTPRSSRPRRAPLRRRTPATPRLERLEGRIQLSIAPVTNLTQITSAAYDQNAPSVAMDAAGDYVVAWEAATDNTEATSNIVAEVFNPNGSVKVATFTVNSTSTPALTTRQHPSVAMDANGDFVVAWELEPPQNSSTGYYYDIQARRFNLAGVGQGAEFRVNATQTQTPVQLADPTVAMNNNNFVIGWDQQGGSSVDSVKFQRYTFSGPTTTAAGGNVTVATGNTAIEPSVAMDAAGDFVFLYNTYNGAKNQPIGQVYNASGVAQGSFSVNPSASAFNAVVDMNDAGRFVVAYEITTTAGNSPYDTVYAHQYALSGSETSLSVSSLSSDAPVYSEGSTRTQDEPSAAIDNQGFATITWLDYGTSNASNNDTYEARRLNPDGTAIEAAPIVVATATTARNYNHPDLAPQVAVDANGDPIFVAEGDTQGAAPGTGAQIYSRLYQYVNDAPTLAAIANQTVAQNGSTSVPLAGITAGGNEEQTLTVTTSSSNTALIVPTVTYASPNSTGTLNLTPVPGQFGTATITVTVTDSGGTSNGGVNSASRTFTLTVIGAPTANAQSVAVAFNTAKGITLTGSDPNSPPRSLTYAIATSPAHGTLSGFNASTGAVTYTPNANYSGPDSFTFTDSNGINTSAPATVTINVAAGTPTANPQTVAVPHDSPGTPVTLTGSDPDSPPRALTYLVATQPAHGTLSGTAPNLTYTPTAGYHGPDSFTFTVSNGTNTSGAATVTLNVATGTPTANPQSVSTNQGTPVAVTLSGTDDDTPALPLTYSIATGPAHGTLTGTAPNLTYTPAAGYSGADSFTFTVSNGTNTSAAATVSLNVKPSAATVSGTVGISWGTAGAASLSTNADGLRLLPTGRNTDLPWLGINKLTITLSQAATLSPADVTVTGVNVASYGPVTISGSGTTYTITLAQPINAADRVTVTIGNSGIATFTRRLDVLPGDFNDDGGVTVTDAAGIRNQYLGFAGATPTTFGDINGDGVVDVNDYNEARRRIGTVLP